VTAIALPRVALGRLLGGTMIVTYTDMMIETNLPIEGMTIVGVKITGATSIAVVRAPRAATIIVVGRERIIAERIENEVPEATGSNVGKREILVTNSCKFH
jgi:hypothetical protein